MNGNQSSGNSERLISFYRVAKTGKGNSSTFNYLFLQTFTTLVRAYDII